MSCCLSMISWTSCFSLEDFIWYDFVFHYSALCWSHFLSCLSFWSWLSSWDTLLHSFPNSISWSLICSDISEITLSRWQSLLEVLWWSKYTSSHRIFILLLASLCDSFSGQFTLLQKRSTLTGLRVFNFASLWYTLLWPEYAEGAL